MLYASIKKHIMFGFLLLDISRYPYIIRAYKTDDILNTILSLFIY